MLRGPRVQEKGVGLKHKVLRDLGNKSLDRSIRSGSDNEES